MVDCGVLPERQENLVRAMADGIIQFVVVPEGDKLRHYINIPKMRGAFPRNKMLSFTSMRKDYSSIHESGTDKYP